jgi:RNA polymerase sigma-70 factor (ECF subfamily)
MSRAGAEQFTTTRWTLVLAAVIRHEPSGAEAFARLCEGYYAPLYGYLRRRGHAPEDAQDLTQGFIAQLLEKDVLRHADPARGRFRAFLLTSLKHYAANIRVRASAAKRGGGGPHQSLDLAAAERRYCSEPGHDVTPERMYDRRWALTVLESALTALRTEFRTAGREPFFDVVHGHLTGDGDTASYREIGERFGMTEAAIKVAMYRMRRRFRDLLRMVVAATVEDERDVDDELRFLMSVLRA